MKRSTIPRKVLRGIIKVFIVTKLFPKKCFSPFRFNFTKMNVASTSSQKYDFCKEDFSNLEDLKNHIISLHIEIISGISKDSACNLENSTEKVQIQAENGQHSKMFQCEFCGKSYLFKPNLKKHINNKHKGIKYKCEHCDKTFKDKQELNLHRDNTHEGKKYKCSKCEKYRVSKIKSVKKKWLYLLKETLSTQH